MIIPGKPVPYDVLQFHVHTGSDHAIDGRYFGADLHIVHKEVGGESYSVLGFFLEPTDADGIPKFSDLLTEWEKVATATAVACKTGIGVSNSTAQQGGRKLSLGSERKLARSFNPYELLPAGATMYTYQGSLTTPPCSEVVFWNVVDTPVSISPREFLRLVTLIIDYVDLDTCQKASVAADSGFTGRPVQNINGRPINRICPIDFVDPLSGVTSSVEGSATSPTEAPKKTTSGAAASSVAAGFALTVLVSIL